MVEVEVQGAILPDGINVDEAAAYFGVVESSDSLHSMLEMECYSALSMFIEMTADIHLLPGEFDYEAASNRMNCEGGEIYYLVAEHFQLIEKTEKLCIYLGIKESDGGIGKATDLSDEEELLLEQLTNIMRLLKLFSIAHFLGGKEKVMK